MFSPRIQSQTFLRGDIENILKAVHRAHRPSRGRQAEQGDDYGEGFARALEAVAEAFGVPLDTPASRRNGR